MNKNFDTLLNTDSYKFTPKNTTYIYLRTYGCQMNILDSEIITGILTELGYSIVNDEEKADAVIFNTCSVRDLSERKVLGKLGTLSHKRKRRPEIVLGVCGCMAELSADRLLKKNPHIDFACGTKKQALIPQLLYSAFLRRISNAEITNYNAENIERLKKAFPVEDNSTQSSPDPNDTATRERIAVGLQPLKYEDGHVTRMSGLVDERIALRPKPWSAYVEIIRGCSNFCTYCVVPYARGPEVSRQSEDIISEIQDLAGNGCLEITLLGQNVNSYGKDLGGNENVFPNLLRKIQSIDGLNRIRLLTSNPQDISDELINAIADCDKICHQIHFPLQSGSDRILKLMRRKYTLTDYIEKVDKIRKAVPDMVFSSDFIVGFPGESDEDFKATRKAMEIIRYSSAFIFKYSKRSGTAAAELEDDVPVNVKKQRHQELLSLQNQTTYEFHEKLIGSSVEVLVEGKSKRNPDMAQGRTRRYFNIVFPNDNDYKGGEIVNVKITRATKLSLYGKIDV